MAVVTSYSWQSVAFLDLDSASALADVTALANGGFAGLGDNASLIEGTLFGASGAQTGANWQTTGFTDGAVAQLSNGNLVVVGEDVNSVGFHIVNSVTGAEVVAETDLGDVDTENADVAALTGGGWVVVYEDAITPSNSDIELQIYNNAGVFQTGFTVDASLDPDTVPCIAALDGGGFAVAWTRTFGVETEIWYAVYNAAGGVVLGPTLADTTGSINKEPAICAMDGGGFALVYRDNEWDGDVDITLGRYSSAGVFIDKDNVAPSDGVLDGFPTVARMSNGFLAVAYTAAFGDNDTYLRLVDPSSGTVLATEVIEANESLFDFTQEPSIAGFAQGSLAVFHTNTTDSDIDGEHVRAVRTSTGDGAANVISGDGLFDVINGGGGNDTLSGLGGNDTMDGDAGADTLNGGLGADTMTGGDGNDTYIVDNAGDVTTEASAGGGTDLVQSSVTRTLGANLENLTLTGSLAINGIGNSLANVITGNSFANVLSGGGGADVLKGGPGGDKLSGGAGLDTLVGGAGNDKFVFSAAPNAANRDVITDYNVANDTIQIENSVFVGIGGAGVLAAAALFIGAAAADSSDRIIYNSVTGRLYFDADGLGGAAQIQFATLSAGLALTNADFVVI